MLLLSLLLVACADTAADTTPTPPPAPSIPVAEMPTISPPPPTPLPSPTYTATPTLSPTYTATPTPAFLDNQAQAAALVPGAATVLEQAAQWDKYVIHATLDPLSHTISGTMEVQVTNHTAAPLDTLFFHLYPNHSDFGTGSLWVSDQVLQDGHEVAIQTAQDDVLLQVMLEPPLAAGDATVIRMQFRARTPVQSSGDAYGAFNHEAGVWTLASAFPVLAQLTATGWDTRPIINSQGDLAVTDTALYDVTLDAPTGWVLVTTGTQVAPDATQGTQVVAAGMQRLRFVSGPQRDFFIAALAGLEQQSTTVNGTRITSYYQPDHAAAGHRSLDVVAQAWDCYTTAYGSNPLEEIEIIQTALTYFIGVEYPGVMLIEQSLYWENGVRLETTIAHEVSHQWWYNMVGNDAREEPWIDEGLASYSQVAYYTCMGDMGQAVAERQTFEQQYQIALDNGLDGPINQHAEDMVGNYVSLAYAKSALFFLALRDYMGEETFSRFLQTYATTYRYHMVTGDEVLSLAEQVCNCGVREFAAGWVEP